jgi:hypothetical protein
MAPKFNIGQQPAYRPTPRSLHEIDRDEIVRQTLEEAAKRLIGLHGNSTYRRAFEISAQLLRKMKP